MTEQPQTFTADAVTHVPDDAVAVEDLPAAAAHDDGPLPEPQPEQTDNRPREEDGEQLPEDVALGTAPLPDA